MATTRSTATPNLTITQCGDFRGNYWGTTDPDQILAWISDGHYNPNFHSEVLFTPFATGLPAA